MQVLLLENIAQLVAYNFHVTNLSIDVGVWVPVYPAVDTSAGDEVYTAVLHLLHRQHPHRRV